VNLTLIEAREDLAIYASATSEMRDDSIENGASSQIGRARSQLVRVLSKLAGGRLGRTEQRCAPLSR
jgi:hypothetical protein